MFPLSKGIVPLRKNNRVSTSLCHEYLLVVVVQNESIMAREEQTMSIHAFPLVHGMFALFKSLFHFETDHYPGVWLIFDCLFSSTQLSIG
jgi:hypothetical protein